MTQGSTKDSDEWLAEVLSRKELGVEVARHDDNSRQSMYDLTSTYSDGRQAAAEVVSTRDKHAVKQAIEAGRRGYTRHGRLTRKWHVRVDEKPNSTGSPRTSFRCCNGSNRTVSNTFAVAGVESMAMR